MALTSQLLLLSLPLSLALSPSLPPLLFSLPIALSSPSPFLSDPKPILPFSSSRSLDLDFETVDEPVDPEVEADIISAVVAGLTNMTSAIRRSAVCDQHNITAELDVRVQALMLTGAEMNQELSEAERMLEATKERQDGIYTQFWEENVTPEPPACSYPFEVAADGCFWLHKNPDRPWQEARDHCRSVGADLATPSNVPQVREYVGRKLGRDWSYIWVGATKTGWRSFEWLNGSAVRRDNDWWELNDPPAGEKCVILFGFRGYTLRQYDCSDDNYYLCEKKI